MTVKESVRWIQSLLLAVCVLVVSSQVEPEFASEDDAVYTVSRGDSVFLNCEVNYRGLRNVNWFFLTHQTQISRNEDILVDDGRYSIQRVSVFTGIYNLHISNVQDSDAGKYKCSLEGSPALIQISMLVVEDAPQVPINENLPPVNFTDCCVRADVSAGCLPACHPSTIDLNTFDAETVCAADLYKLVRCGTDGRNHAPCCHRRFIPTECLGFCVNDFASISEDHLVCLDHITEIVECMEEGQHVLPSTPTSVSGKGVSSSEIQVTWLTPEENRVTAYKVLYKEDTESAYTSTGLLQVPIQNYLIEGLTPLTKYKVYVIAINEHGSSLPSYIMEIYTLSNNALPPGVTEASFAACCVRRSVTEECQPYLCGGWPETFDQSVMYSCYNQADKVQQCLQGEQDHTECCQARGIPQECLMMCSGSVLNLGFEDAHCLNLMPTITLCFQENSELLPSAPYDVELRIVQTTSATVYWKRPEENADVITYYDVVYEVYGSGDYKNEYARGLYVELDDLKASTMYRVWVTANSDKGPSLPSIGIVFMTYAPDGGIIWERTTVMPETPAPPVDLKQCCVDSGVPEHCLPFCQYGQEFGIAEAGLALSCLSEISLMLKCAADGRNHTPCCRRRNVDAECLELCAYNDATEDTFNLGDHILCALGITEILECFEDGIATIPGVPRGLMAVNWTTHSVALAWGEPARIPEPITGYIVKYRAVEDKVEQKQKRTPADTTHIILQPLEPDFIYEMWVMAYNQHGESLPSDVITIQTLQEKADLPNMNFSMPVDLTECCQDLDVSEECMPACSGTGVVNMDTCSKDLGSLVTCAADGKDHKTCCRHSRVPERCLHFCEGKPEATSWEQLLCLSFTEQMLSCFREGFEDLPSPPLKLRRTSYTSTSVALAWDAPERNADEVSYIVYYKESSAADYGLYRSKELTYVLEGLTPTQSYLVYVVAVNGYGASKPSPILTVWTDSRSEPVVEVFQSPHSGYIPEGGKVILTCNAKGNPSPTVYWLRDDNPKHLEQRIITYDSVSREDAGMYTCVAENGVGNGKTDKLELRVQYAPEIDVPEQSVYVEMGKGLTAHLICNFRGYPNTIKWKKGNDDIPPTDSQQARRYAQHTATLIPGKLLQAKLSIVLLTSTNYGQYSCSGTNVFGSAIDYVQLLDPTAVTPDPGVVPTFTPAPRELNITACCIREEVSAQCMPACSFDIDLTALTDPIACIDDVPLFVKCGADGKDHTKCCADNQVPSICWPYCSGAVQTDDHVLDEHLACLSSLDDILSCMENGTDNIPSAPQSLRGRVVNGYIELDWSAPNHNKDKVSNYVVHYRAGHNGDKSTLIVGPKNFTAYLKSVFGYTTYYITVRAGNHHGESQDSNFVNITTYELRPSAPTDFKAILVDEQFIRLTWGKPVFHAGAVQKYRIHYGSTPDTKLIEVGHELTTYRLEDLQPQTTYTCYVVAKSSHYLSDKTDEVSVKTGKFKASTSPAKHSSDSNATGVGVGVFFLLLIVIIVVAALAFYFLRIRKRSPRQFEDSVAFENPGYATASEARISGLPGESVHSVSGHDDSSIMREALAAGDGHKKVYLGAPLGAPLTNGEADTVNEPPYATLPVDMMQANASMDKVNINFEEPILNNNSMS